MFWLWSFLIYWLVMFVTCYVVVDFGQRYYYEEPTKHAALRVAAGSLIFAALLTRRGVVVGRLAGEIPAWYDGVLASPVLLAAVLTLLAFAVFTLLFEYHPRHAIMIGPATVLIMAVLAGLAVDSLRNAQSGVPRETRAAPKVPRKRAGTLGPPPKAEVPAPAR